MEIYNRFSGGVIYKDDSASMRECVLNAICANISLSEADLSWANLSEANLRKTVYMACPTHGAFVGWKKCGKYIVKLQILEESRRSSATTAKCRCDKALVLAIENIDGTPTDIIEIASNYDHSFKYKVGEVVEVQDFDENRFNECAAGIHFYVDRRAAEELI